MRKLILLSSIAIIVTLLAYTALSMGGGTLGAVANHELNCSDSKLGYELDNLIRTDKFKTSIADTNNINRWKEGGYDFLNYRCLNIHQTLYMITINSEDGSSSNIAIRAFYSRKRKTWVYAVEFTRSEKKKAEKEMEYLLTQVSGC